MSHHERLRDLDRYGFGSFDWSQTPSAPVEVVDAHYYLIGAFSRDGVLQAIAIGDVFARRTRGGSLRHADSTIRSAVMRRVDTYVTKGLSYGLTLWLLDVRPGTDRDIFSRIESGTSLRRTRRGDAYPATPALIRVLQLPIERLEGCRTEETT